MAEWVLQEQYEIKEDFNTLTLPAGSFIVPIAKCYVPKDTVYRLRHHTPVMTHKLTDAPFEYCYTRYGILPIPSKVIRRIK